MHPRSSENPEEGPLASHPVPTAEADEDLDEDIERHHDASCSIVVTQSPGFLCHIKATARIALPPSVLWEQCLVHPDNAKIFRHMDRCSYRRILSPGSSRTGQASPQAANCTLRKVRVAHEASWRFMMFSGKFTTHLDVEEVEYLTDAGECDAREMRFELLPNKGSSIVSRFHGVWVVKPDSDPNVSLSTLDQDIALGVWMPPPFDRILKSISARQVKRIFQDLHEEAARINAGTPTLVPYSSVKDKEIGAEQDE